MPQRIIGASNNSVEVKPASTAAVAADNALVVTLSPSTAAAPIVQGASTIGSGGAIPGKVLSTATTNATNLKNAPGQLYGLCLSNTNAAVRYIRFYNLATAPTVGTSVPLFTIPLPGATTGGAPIAMDFGGVGINMSVGISYAITTGATDLDSGATAVNEIQGVILYA